MSIQFEQQVTVKAHANYGAFRATNNSFYKPTGNLKLEDFTPGQTYNVKGYASDSGKTNYITMVVKDSLNTVPIASTTAVVPKRRLALPKEEQVEVAGDDKGLKRDFKKEAKGKTVSLFIAALLPTKSPAEAITLAEEAVRIMEEKGYF